MIKIQLTDTSTEIYDLPFALTPEGKAVVKDAELLKELLHEDFEHLTAIANPS